MSDLLLSLIHTQKCEFKKVRTYFQNILYDRFHHSRMICNKVSYYSFRTLKYITMTSFLYWIRICYLFFNVTQERCQNILFSYTSWKVYLYIRDSTNKGIENLSTNALRQHPCLHFCLSKIKALMESNSLCKLIEFDLVITATYNINLNN